MKYLITLSLIVSIVLFSAPVAPQGVVIVHRRTGGGGGGGGSRAIIFNGTSQYGVTSALPNAAPWNALGAHQTIFRVRSLPTFGRLWYTGGDVISGIFAYAVTATTMAMVADRDAGADITLTIPSGGDLVGKAQFDPANSRYTFELWTKDGTGHVQGTLATANTGNFNFNGDKLSVGAAPWGALFGAFHMDWIAWKSGVDALNVFPGAEPAAGTYMALYKFDADTGADTSGNGLNFTLNGTPTFEDTP